MISLLCWDLYLTCVVALSEGSVPKQRSKFGRAQVPWSACLMLLHFSLRVVLFHSFKRVSPFREKFCFADGTEVVVLVSAKRL